MNDTTVVYSLLIVFILLLLSGSAVAQTKNSSIEGEKIIDIEDDKANIVLQSDKISSEPGEPVIVHLSATNYIDTRQPIKIQLILESVQGVGISGGTAQQGADNQFSTVTTLEPGNSDSVRIEVSPNRPGTYTISGEIIYFTEGNSDESTKKRISTEIRQKQPPRSIWWWMPTLGGFLSASAISGYLFRTTDLDTIRYVKHDHEDFWAALKYVLIASFSVGFSAMWFSSYARDADPLGYGIVFSILAFVIGLILSAIGKHRFTPRLRVALAFISCISVLAIPLQLFFSYVMFPIFNLGS